MRITHVCLIACSALSFSSCAAEHGCTLKGCSTGVAIDFGARSLYGTSEELLASICIGDAGCTEVTITDDGCEGSLKGDVIIAPGHTCLSNGKLSLFVFAPVEEQGTQTVSITLANEDTTLFAINQEVSFGPRYVNGPDCGVTCYVGEMEVRP